MGKRQDRVQEEGKAPSSAYFDVEELASTYASFHDHPMNQAIHFVCVPLLLYSLWLGIMLALPAIGWHVSFGVAIAWGFYLVCLHPSGGIATLAVFLALNVGASRTYAALEQQGSPEGSPNVRMGWIIVGASQAFGWGVQVLIGHNYYEGKCNDNDAKPATATSLWINLVSPFFLVLENLFRLGLFGELAARVNARAQAKIRARRQVRKAAAAAGGHQQ